MKKKLIVAGFLPLLIIMGACTQFTPQPRTNPEGSLPAAYSLYPEEPATPDRWWQNFDDDELSGLVETALTANMDLLQAWARLKQANASAVKSGAAKYPSLDASGDYSHTRTRPESGGPAYNTETHELGLAASYELDLWGRINATTMADTLEANATREDMAATAMTVASEVASRWLEIKAQRELEKLVRAQIKTNETYLELIELRFENALSTALDVYQQREAVASAKSKLPPILLKQQTLHNQLNMLLGKPAGSTIVLAERPLPDMPAPPASGLPADLLAKRPDVRAAGLRLHSADWSVAAARADRLPSLNLTGNGQFNGAQLATLFDGWMYALAASITGPIFDGGSRRAEVERTRAVAEEHLYAYRETVLTAVMEVENAMAGEQWQRKYVAALQAELDAARNNFKEALARYVAGLTEYLDVLSALTSVQDLEISLVTNRLELLQYRIGLYEALGGDWMPALPLAKDQKNESPNEEQG